MKRFIAALPFAVLILLGCFWIGMSSAERPAPPPPAPGQFFVLGVILLIHFVAAWQAIRFKLNTAPLAHRDKLEIALVGLTVACAALLYNQVKIGLTGHVMLPMKGGPDPHYYLTTTPVPFLVVAVASALISSFIFYLFVLGLRRYRYER